MSPTINLFGFSRASLEAHLASLGEPSYRSKQILKWIHTKKELNAELWNDLPKSLRELLKESISPPLTLFKKQIENDGTTKLVFLTQKQHAIETILIPHENRMTLCVSSQVGCALNCSFCATAKQGFLINLSASEIIAQLWMAAEHSPSPISNVVFMGMGEPLLNLNAVLESTSLMMDDLAYGLSKRKVTISTAGIVPSIEKLIGRTDVALAVSLHAPFDDLRSELVPINQKYPIAELLASCRAYLDSLKERRFITFEYIMLKDINDSLLHAKALGKLLMGIRSKINLIPYNPHPFAPYKTSDEETIQAFSDRLRKMGYITTIRKSRGDEIQAACGQLTGTHNKIKKINLDLSHPSSA